MLPAELYAEVRKLEIETNRLINAAFSGEYLSAFKGRGVEFETVRPYVPGDEVRSIDWHVSARTQQLYVKVFREERELSVFFIVDTSASLFFGTQRETKRQLAVRLTALLSLVAMKNHDRAGLMLTDPKDQVLMMPRKGRSYVLRLLREVLAYEPQTRTTHLGAALEKAQKVLKKRSVVFVLSDFYSTDYRKPLEIMARKHDVVPIVLRDSLEKQFPRSGFLRLIDAETGNERLVWTKTAQAYTAAAAKELEDLIHGFRSLRLEPLLVETGQPYLPVLLDYFARKTKRRQY